MEKLRGMPWSIATFVSNTFFVQFTFFGSVFPLFLAELGLSKGQMGFLFSLMPFLGLIAPFIAPWTAQFGYKRTYLTFFGIRKLFTVFLLLTPWVQSSYGFSGDLGGGPYDRSAAVRAANQTVAIDVSAAGNVGGFFDIEVWQVGVSHLTPDDGSGSLFASLREAVAVWNLQPPGTTGVIVLMDSLSDHADDGGGPVEIEIGERSQLPRSSNSTFRRVSMPQSV